MKKFKKKQALLLASFLLVASFFLAGNVFAQENQRTTEAASPVGVTYQTHVQNQGWSGWVADGEISGTAGQGLRMEALKIQLVNAPAEARIEYHVHVENQGDQSVRKNGELAGTEGQGLRLEAVNINLINMPGYSVEYRVHIENQGWTQGWVSDGALAGTRGLGLRLEAMEIRIIKTDDVVHPVSVSLDKGTANLTVGESQALTATVLPVDTTNKSVTWSSDNTAVAIVDENGSVTGVSAGIATIVVTTVDGNKTDNCVVTVVAPGAIVTEPVNLGTAANFAILAKTGISTVPDSSITGDIGVSPIAAAAMTGFSLTADATNVFATSPQITGKAYASDYAAPTGINLTTAVSDMETAYVDAAGRAVNYTNLFTGDISGQTLTPGVYKWDNDVLINSDVTLSGGPNDVFIFQIAKGITQASDTKVILTGGVQAENIFWQASETVSIGTGAHFEGIVLGQTNIGLGSQASINGRLLTQTAVTLIQSTVVAPV
ncbi:ice-binding family protein [Acetobacterium sp.]|uniref:ice-binding family protein n=1 Tax=Acetobacterium sp. TaxID=1872094 RepID=UPI003593CB2E